jgi:hypothetical protein
VLVFLFQLKALKKKHSAALAPPTMSKKVAELQPPPEFIAAREELWQRLKAEREAWLAAQAPQDIWYVLPLNFCSVKISVADPGCFSRIRFFFHPGFRIHG